MRGNSAVITLKVLLHTNMVRQVAGQQSMKPKSNNFVGATFSVLCCVFYQLALIFAVSQENPG